MRMTMTIKYSENFFTTTTLKTQKEWPLFKGDCFSEVFPQKLISILESWGSGWSLYTGGHCSELVVNTGLTEHIKKAIKSLGNKIL